VTAKNRDAHRDSASSWGSAGAVCSTRAGLLVLAYQPVRWALKVDGEVGLNGLAGFSGFAAPATAGPIGGARGVAAGTRRRFWRRIFRRWAGDADGRHLIGPAVSFGLVNLRIFVAALRATARGSHETAVQVHVGLGYM
jgi:hypothetical protein